MLKFEFSYTLFLVPVDRLYDIGLMILINLGPSFDKIKLISPLSLLVGPKISKASKKKGNITLNPFFALSINTQL